MYKSSFYIKIFYSSLILIIGFIYYFATQNNLYFTAILIFYIWFLYYLKNLKYIVSKKYIIKKTGRFFKTEKRLNLDKIISLTSYNLKILKLKILIIKHLEGKMLITFLSAKDINKMIRKINEN